MPVDPDECLLDQVLRLFAVPHRARYEVLEALVVAAHDLGERPVISVEKPLYHLAVGQGRNRAPGLFGRVSPLGTAAICSKKLAAGHCSLLALRAPAGSVGTGSLGCGPCGRGTVHEACQYLERVPIGLGHGIPSSPWDTDSRLGDSARQVRGRSPRETGGGRASVALCRYRVPAGRELPGAARPPKEAIKVE